MDIDNNTDMPSSSDSGPHHMDMPPNNTMPHMEPMQEHPAQENDHKMFPHIHHHETGGNLNSSHADEKIVNPMPVVRVLSPRGVEYVFLIIALFSAAFSLIGAIISLIYGHTSFDVLAYPTAALVVSLPVFAFLFLRLKKAETNNPDARMDPSKRRSTQFTQILSFIICFFVLIGLVSTIFSKLAGSYHGSISKIILDVVVIEVILGGILFYYWRDEHR